MKCIINRQNKNSDIRKEIASYPERYRIGVGDTFTFHCTECGRCCENREDILLSAKDLYRIAKEMNASPMEIVKGYCEVYIGHSSHLPIIRLLPVGIRKSCPFLSGHRCSIHKVKPAVCALYPLGRGMVISKGENELEGKSKEIQYVFLDPTCGDKSESHTVRDYLNMFGIPEEDPYFIQWTQMLVKLSMFISKHEKDFDHNILSTVQTEILKILYLNYDITKDFVLQFEENISVAERLLEALTILEEKNGAS